MESGVIREEEKRLKKNIIANLEAQFVDQFEKWKERSDVFNMIVADYNKANGKRLRPIKYDQYCKLFIGGSKALLEEHVKMHDIIPNKSELDGIKAAIDSGDANDFRQKYTSLLEAKYAVVKKTLAKVWDMYVFKHMVNTRYGSQHYHGMLAVKMEVTNGD